MAVCVSNATLSTWGVVAITKMFIERNPRENDRKEVRPAHASYRP